MLAFENLRHLGPRGLVAFCFRCALRADEVMRSGRYVCDWTEPRAAAYRRGLDAVREWIVAEAPTPEHTDRAGLAAVDAVAASYAAVTNAIDAGDDSNGARAVRAAAEGMAMALATTRTGGDLWTPEYHELFSRMESYPWQDMQPGAVTQKAMAAVERLEHVNPYEERGRLLPALHDDIMVLVEAQQNGVAPTLADFGPLWAWDSGRP